MECAAFPLVRTVHRVSETESTSTLARQLVSGEDPPPQPLLVWADRQTAGRGRGTNRWWSDDGSLTFTVVLNPDAFGLPHDRRPTLSLALGVGLIDALEAGRMLRPGTAGLRWPNDIEIADRKVAGLLIELVESRDGPRLLIGIGINVTTRFDNAPPDIQRMATSLEREAAAPWSHAREAVMAAALAGVSRALTMFDLAELVDRWNSIDLLRGRRVVVEIGSERIEGLGAGIDATGRLLLATESGVRPIVAGTVLRF
jgi:BirA family biotin operon repressor/biotin-[acetyl-CoA-carboxylase] ligase